MSRLKRGWPASPACFPDKLKFERMSCKKKPDAGASGLKDILHLFLGTFHVNPLACFGRLENGITNVLGAEGVPEIREVFGNAWVI